jgi:predicted Zn-ribbon and HTH transcriptional regulator
MRAIRSLFAAVICFLMRGLTPLLVKSWITDPGFEETNFNKAVLQFFPQFEKLLMIVGFLLIVLSVLQVIAAGRENSTNLPPEVEAKIKDFGEPSANSQTLMKQIKCLYCGSKLNETSRCPNCGAAAISA